MGFYMRKKHKRDKSNLENRSRDPIASSGEGSEFEKLLDEYFSAKAALGERASKRQIRALRRECAGKMADVEMRELSPIIDKVIDGMTPEFEALAASRNTGGSLISKLMKCPDLALANE